MRRLGVILAVFALTGCGSGDDDTGAAEASGELVAVSLLDFRLDPETIRLDGAGTYTFRATNDGQEPHALEVEGGDIEEETETLEPGESGEVTVELAEGEYELYCPVGDHRERGMEGVLVVGGGATTDDDENGTVEMETGETDTGETETESEDESGPGY